MRRLLLAFLAIFSLLILTGCITQEIDPSNTPSILDPSDTTSKLDPSSTNTEITFSVQFYNEGILHYETTVLSGEDVKNVVNPHKEGHKFIGWDQDYTEVTQNLVINAIFEINVYEVRFFYNNNQIGETQLINDSEAATAPTPPEVSGRVFSNWSIDFDNVKNDLNVYAVYVEETIPSETVGEIYFTVQFYNEDTLHYETTVLSGEGVLNVLDPNKEGHEFIGWDQDYTQVTKNLVINAIFKINVYEVKFFHDNNQIGETQLVNYNEAAIAPTPPEVSGEVFSNWSDDFNNIKSDLNIYAVYKTSIEKADFLEVFYLNDLHGSIVEKPTYDRNHEIGVAKIANLINQTRNENPNTIFLSGGDMLQGSALSNYYKGQSLIEILNLMQLDVFVVGNHEFDWGIEEVTKHFIGQNPIANFPLLAANIFEKGTNNLLEGAQPYTILDRGGFQIGVIGYIGYGLESSIAGTKIEKYEFRAPFEIVKSYTQYLREVEHVDFVIVVGHDGGSNAVTRELANLTGEYKIDMIYGAHNHVEEIITSTNKPPIMQSMSNGKRVGYVKLNNFNDKLYVDQSSLKNYQYNQHPLLQEEDPEVAAKIFEYQAETDELFKEVLIYNEEYISKSAFAGWLSKLIAIKTGSDVGTYNSGGVRDNIPAGNITLGDVYKYIPFDNLIISTLMDGYDVNRQISRNLGYNNTGSYIDNNEFYRIVTNEYVFYHIDNPYLYTPEIDHVIYEGDIIQWVIEEFRLQHLAYGKFSIDIFENPIISRITPHSLMKGWEFGFNLFI